jgi:Phage integrase, N-terminal SAM-like domain
MPLKQYFFERGHECGLKGATIYKYWRWTRRLIFMRGVPIHPDSLNDEAILAFVLKVQSSGLSRSSINQLVDALCFLFGRVLRKRMLLLRELRNIRGTSHRIEGTSNPENLRYSGGGELKSSACEGVQVEEMEDRSRRPQCDEAEIHRSPPVGIEPASLFLRFWRYFVHGLRKT